eukprot:TRINITY_DN4752_c0_g1::TRINITY_DN4752_c0_g1_i1::g.21309::m.21309 TRINITY_DN4752_c0_g1::TRINITY_DN4752_c0_g1_i1::g.21309  ORF type:complete len:604 (-),score=195.27,sp/Q9L9D7/COCE_RHOSM/30.60/2e-59,PepX_C/PF08530.5/41,PepX_C/PF08530.5/1.8e-44,Peptidase_S15/PF02129.13/1.1e-27,Peptidase_S15/PF02129.13/1e-05 TRINITY_DN4752_c0_g1_i1:198-1967(-)
MKSSFVWALIALVALPGLLAFPSFIAQSPKNGGPLDRLVGERMFRYMLEVFSVEDPSYLMRDVVMKSYQIEMRDGVKLETRVFIPIRAQGKRVPAILDRTPYGPLYTAMSLIWSVDEYVIVMQDQRGTYGSEGNFEVWRMDGQDAYDTCAWIAQQDWSDGTVFTWGISADANSVYPQIYDVGNPWVKAQFPVFGSANGHELVYPQGAYKQELVEGWLDTVCTECIQTVKEHELEDEWWDPINATAWFHNVKFPSVHWTGWYDIFLEHQIEAFEGYYRKADDSMKGEAYLFVDPHGHCYDIPFTSGISLAPLWLARDTFKMVHTGQKPDDSILDRLKHITFYVMGPQFQPGAGNFYTTMDEWPVSTPTTYYLAPGNKLEAVKPAEADAVTYVYDPTDPVPNLGGNNLFGTCGPYDQQPLESRDDMILFSTDVLTQDVAIVGIVKVRLFVSSDAVDTDFMVKLTDVYPSGQSHLITEGAIRMRWRESKKEESKKMVPGEMYEVEVRLWTTAMVFNAGHRIRITVSSSNSDRFSATPNTGAALVDEVYFEPVIAHNTIYMGGDVAASSVELPVVTMDQIPEVDIRDFAPKRF